MSINKINDYTYMTNKFKITFLQDRLFRIETINFTDEFTQVIINRSFSNYFNLQVIENKKCYIFKTDKIKVLIDNEGKVKSILLLDKNKLVTDFQKGNLKGTYRTLDGVNGACRLDDGIISTSGVAVLDDSKSLIVKNNKLYKRDNCLDLYYFAYGNNYQEALDAFYKLTGNVPLIPRFALGNWWSRYHAYSDDEYIELIEKFKEKNIPINVSVIDMDWHYVDNKKEFDHDYLLVNKDVDYINMYYDGWTGYSWNKHLFKDYRKFLSYLKDNNLKVTLNLHPALGVRKYEDQFEEMAKYLNIDSNKVDVISFDVTDDKYMEAYFKVLHHPYEKDGVNFWWIDWQQGTGSKMEGLDPLWSLNHYHYLDNNKGNNRPLILSRYSGPGSHRYPLGFSGDTYITWESLQFQPYFTATSTNIGYVWWSHDIGGHMCGVRDNELYIRWLQLGVFSPINRLHSTCNLYTGKEPWKFNSYIESIATKFLQLRKGLIPYLYSMNYQTYKYNKALVTPMYYYYNNSLAYKYKNQFMFGSELLVMPITSKTNKVTSLAKVKGYLPEGIWFDIFTDNIYVGNQQLEFYRELDKIPVFAKEGSIIPLYVDKITNNIDNNQDLELLVYSGNNTFEFYEDDGESKDYLNNQFSIRKFIVYKNEKEVNFKITSSSNGNYKNYIVNRNLYIKFKDIVSANITCNVDYETIKDKCLVIKVNDTNNEITVNLDNIIYLSNLDKKERIVDLTSSYQMLNDLKNDLFLQYYLDDVNKTNIPSYLKGPIIEILKQK